MRLCRKHVLAELEAAVPQMDNDGAVPEPVVF
jgi:hypothetical protein